MKDGGGLVLLAEDVGTLEGKEFAVEDTDEEDTAEVVVIDAFETTARGEE